MLEIERAVYAAPAVGIVITFENAFPSIGKRAVAQQESQASKL
jgi:hypothetical protein